MACESTGWEFCVWIKHDQKGRVKGWWRCYFCGRRRRARR